MPFDIITIGDSTIDTFIRIHDAAIECDLNKKDCRICVEYGGKIPVESIAYGMAGNAANVAAACSKLGMQTAIYTHIGNDWQGEMIKKQFDNFKIAQDYVTIDEVKKSNLSVVLTFQGERTIFSYHQDWFYHLPKLSPCRWLYLTSLSETFVDSNIIDEVAHYVDVTHAKLVFAPGTYQIKANVKRFKNTLERCAIFICNLEEAKDILEINEDNDKNKREILDKMLALGPKIVAITDGEEGSLASDGQKYLKLGILPTKVVEKTGAGDAWGAAFIAALNSQLDLATAMVWGAINSSHVISEVGAQNGLLTKEDLERYRKTVVELIAVNL